MKHLSQTTQIGFFLVAGLPLLAGHTQAAPAGPLAVLSAKLQASSLNGSGKHLSTIFDPNPEQSVLSKSQSRLTGANAAPKRLFIDPLTTLLPAPKNRVSTQIKRLARHLGRDTASPKRLSVLISATPSWK